MSLFDYHARQLADRDAPLAARMRPRKLEEFVGQSHIVGPGRLLRRAIEADQLSSVIFHGPPGTGKTTLARVIAGTTHAQFIAINAVLAGVKDLREAIQKAQDTRGQFDRRTILFVDEVHRFNKAQQDALLPWVENGTVILIGATTENPYFEVNKALVSRSRVFQLRPLTADELRQVVRQALTDRERGFGKLAVRLSDDALDHLVNVANGDARALLNALELAVETTGPDAYDEITIDLTVAEESIQRRAVLYDKEGDAHFDTISAYIKSVRGSDPDAALYWLARMVYAGEDPRFILRRLLILASEDIGLADPYALGVVTAAAAAFDRVGMPEGRYHLAHATLYLATTAKSNTTMGFFDALAAVEKEREADVPTHLRDASRDAEGFGHGEGYLYPHAYRDHWVAQQYLPGALQGRVFYQPSDQGYEGGVRDQVARQREAQLAAMLDQDGFSAPGEVLTHGPRDPGLEAWLQRTLGSEGQRLGRLRDALFELAAVERHHVVLDLRTGSGLLLWEAVRRTPEGHAWAWTPEAGDLAALEQAAEQLPELRRPHLLGGTFEALTAALRPEGGQRFDRIVGRNVLVQVVDKVSWLTVLSDWLAGAASTLTLAESVPRRGQRVYGLCAELLGEAVLSERLGVARYARWREAEEAIFADATDPMVAWDEADLRSAIEAAGLVVVRQRLERQPTVLRITDAVVRRWFGVQDQPGTYGRKLSAGLEADDLAAIERVVRAAAEDQSVPWHAAVCFVQAARR